MVWDTKTHVPTDDRTGIAIGAAAARGQSCIDENMAFARGTREATPKKKEKPWVRIVTLSENITTERARDIKKKRRRKE